MNDDEVVSEKNPSMNGDYLMHDQTKAKARFVFQAFSSLPDGFASQIQGAKEDGALGGSSLAHISWDFRYHIIFIPKFRRKVFLKEIRKEVGEILRTLCEYRNVELVKGSISADHVHMCVKIPPKLSVSEFMGYLKISKKLSHYILTNGVNILCAQSSFFAFLMLGAQHRFIVSGRESYYGI